MRVKDSCQSYTMAGSRLRWPKLAAAANDDIATREDGRRLGACLAGILPLDEALGIIGRWEEKHRFTQRDPKTRGAQAFARPGILLASAKSRKRPQIRPPVHHGIMSSLKLHRRSHNQTTG